MDYKIIFSDMDGTLLNKQSEISDVTKTSIEAMGIAGMPFVLTTGRSIHGVKHALETFNFVGTDGYVISYHGGMIHHLKNMKVLHRNTYRTEDVRSIIEYAKTFTDITILFYTETRFFTYETNHRTDRYESISRVKIEAVDEPLNESDEFIKILFIGDTAKLEEIKTKILAEHSDIFNTFFSNPVYLELVPKDTNKGNALAFVANLLQIPIEETIAVGDSENDISMIQRAGLGVAVANAFDSVKEVADLVTTETNDEHAVAKLIDKYILKK